jgi:hypothetical protein
MNLRKKGIILHLDEVVVDINYIHLIEGIAEFTDALLVFCLSEYIHLLKWGVEISSYPRGFFSFPL